MQNSFFFFPIRSAFFDSNSVTHQSRRRENHLERHEEEEEEEDRDAERPREHHQPLAPFFRETTKGRCARPVVRINRLDDELGL